MSVASDVDLPLRSYIKDTEPSSPTCPLCKLNKNRYSKILWLGHISVINCLIVLTRDVFDFGRPQKIYTELEELENIIPVREWRFIPSCPQNVINERVVYSCLYANDVFDRNSLIE